ncbi:MAG: HAD-IA family hydrolase [Miltoncostaeaceae bacterium]
MLVESLMPGFPACAAERTGADSGRVRRLLTDDSFRRAYWGGDLPEAAFWQAAGIPVPDPERRAAVLDIRPVVVPARIARWRQTADIWVVSNHRHEWLLPVLDAAGFTAVVDRIEVSSLTGRVKPDPAAWEALLADGTSPERVAVVDDQQPNLDSARALGLTALLADGGTGWVDQVDAWLASTG